MNVLVDFRIFVIKNLHSDTTTTREQRKLHEMSKENLDSLLQKAESIEIRDFEVKNSMTNIFSRVKEFCEAQSALYLKQNKTVYEFTPKMLHDIFEENNSKYFADLLWTHSSNPKNLKSNPKNEVLFASPRRSVYTWIVVEKKEK